MSEKQNNFTPVDRSSRYVHEKRETPLYRDKRYKTPVPEKLPKTFLGIPCGKVTFTVPTKEERENRRLEFEKDTRAAFIKHLAKTQRKALLDAGITKAQIKGMQQGNTPNGFNTHHIVPIFGGGTNDFSNLILVRREPFHDMMHYHIINPQTYGMETGDSREVTVLLPKTNVYVPPQKFKYLEHQAKKGKKTYGKGNLIPFDFKNDSPVIKQTKKDARSYTAAIAKSRGGR